LPAKQQLVVCGAGAVALAAAALLHERGIESFILDRSERISGLT
jgi:hypothetical protein